MGHLGDHSLATWIRPTGSLHCWLGAEELKSPPTEKSYLVDIYGIILRALSFLRFTGY